MTLTPPSLEPLTNAPAPSTVPRRPPRQTRWLWPLLGLCLMGGGLGYYFFAPKAPPPGTMMGPRAAPVRWETLEPALVE
ncbi:MAG: hypothetical protein ACK5CA_15240, partial [Cyanobacteriota bacterium]